MTDFYIGIVTTTVIISLLELFHSLDKRLIAALILVGISFIYLGFVWQDPYSLTYTIIGASIFFLLSYFGYYKNFKLIILGLLLHGIWDVVFPFFCSILPRGYDTFCITVDLLLAVYFYLRLELRQ